MSIFFTQDPTQICLVLKTRRAARALTRRCNMVLKPYNIQSTQASLLYAIRRGGFRSISELAELLAIERSALTRNLTLLKDRGLVCSENMTRGKAHKVELTPEGNKLADRIKPLWADAHKEIYRELGEDNWDKAQEALSALGAL